MYKINWRLCKNLCVRALKSSSSCRSASTDLPDALSLPISIVHRSREVFYAISCIATDLLYICSSWLSCLCSYMWRGPLEYIACEFVLTSPAVSNMSGSFNFDSFCDAWCVVGQHIAAFLWSVSPGLVQYCLQHSCVIAIKFFLHRFI